MIVNQKPTENLITKKERGEILKPEEELTLERAHQWEDFLPSGEQMNVNLLNKFLETAKDGDFAVYAGTPEEKTAAGLLKGKYANLLVKQVALEKTVPTAKEAPVLNIYQIKNKTVLALANYHSRKTLHNIVEFMWALAILEQRPETVSLSSPLNFKRVGAVVYDKTQIERTRLMLADDQTYFCDHVKNMYPGPLSEQQKGPGNTRLPYNQCLGNRKSAAEQGYTNAETGNVEWRRMFEDRSREHGVTVSKSVWNFILTAFKYETAVENVTPIGSQLKALGENDLLYKFGAGWNYGDLKELLPDAFTMDGLRQNGASDA